MGEEISKYKNQRQSMRAFWRTIKLRDQHDTEADNLRNQALGTLAAEDRIVKDNVRGVLNSIDSDYEEARAALSANNLPQPDAHAQREVVYVPDPENARARLEDAARRVHAEKQLLLQGIALLQEHRANLKRWRPIACCMAIMALVPIAVASTLGIVRFYPRNPTRESTALPTNTPPSTETATIIATNTEADPEKQHFLDPKDFARWYFTAVWQDRNYDYLWTLSTLSFQSLSSGSYSEYETWWSSVERAEIESLRGLENDGHYAAIRVVITFYLVDGRILQDRRYDYDLVFDADRQTWLFDRR